MQHVSTEAGNASTEVGSLYQIEELAALVTFIIERPAQIGVATLDRNSRVLDIIEFIDITGPLVHVEERLACTYRERQAMAPHTGSTGN